MKRIIILDFRTGKVFVRAVPTDMTEADEVANYYENELGTHTNDCQYMITPEEKWLDDNTTQNENKS